MAVVGFLRTHYCIDTRFPEVPARDATVAAGLTLQPERRPVSYGAAWTAKGVAYVYSKGSPHAVPLNQSCKPNKRIFSKPTIEMAVSLDTVKAQNAKLKSLDAGLVGVFVGGTAGIGEFALKAFAQRTTSPKIYIVGR
jgi:hypothetical protein